MRQTQDSEDNVTRAGVVEQDQLTPERASSSSARETEDPRSHAADEARQMLDELAGLDYTRPRSSRPARPNPAGLIKLMVLGPLWSAWAFLKLLARTLQRRDWRLAGEMRKFLRHPGHFFWFQRVAPEAAAQHFGTSSTEAMTQHARRYGSHAAILLLACVVVMFGGFGNLVTRITSTYTSPPQIALQDASMMLVGDGRELYVSAVASNSLRFTPRVRVELVREGQSLRSMAASENLSLETLLYANNLLDPDTELAPGRKLIIPPVSGMLHIANAGDTVGKVAERYGVDPKTILSFKFNNLEEADTSTMLKPLQEVMVPGGSMPLRDTLYMYAVRPGDTLKSIGEKFGLSPDTLLNNNELDNGLNPGQQIRILPVDGVIYRVRKGETLNDIAAYLGTSPDNIINFRPNNVARGVALQADQSLIVPGGSWPPPPPPEPAAPPPPPRPAINAPAPASNGNKAVAPVAPLPKPAVAPVAPPVQKAAPKPAAPGQAVQKPAPVFAPKPKAVPGAGVATRQLIWPLRGVITTYFGEPIWYGTHMGLDISRGCGTPVVAADGGTVVLSGWDGGYGNSVVIDHGGGIRTRYGHFVSRPPVALGQQVARGQVIGYEGTTGASTGCHLHFEVLVGASYTDPLRWLGK